MFPQALSKPDIDPVRMLDEFASNSPSKARQGLAMAIGDIIEFSDTWSVERVAAVDRLLEREKLPTLSEIRLRFSKLIHRVVTRGKIKNEVEYYALRNAVESAQGTDRLWELLKAYEEQTAS
jgi:hypothetical protein